MMLPALFLLITAALGVAQAQDARDRADGIPQLAEDLIGSTEDDDAFESAYEALMQTVSRPLNLNNTAVETLLSLGMLTNEQAKSIEAYRSKNGNFISVYELQAVPELSLETIERIRPYIMVTDEAAALDRTLVKRILQESNNYLLVRVSR